MRRPFEGLKVLDFSHGVAAPYTAMLLGDMGCEVIKIEMPERGDSTRYMNVADRFKTEIPKVGGDYFLAISRNKRSVCIDLKTDDGVRLCRELSKWADIALQSFRPEVMERLGLHYAALKELNPRLIYASLSAFSEDGSLRGKPGMDVAVQARSGVMRLTGPEGSTIPVRPGASMADFAGGIYLFGAIATALYDRERTGLGQEVKLALMDATMSMLINYSVAVMDGDAELQPVGSGHPQLVPYQAFKTADGYVVVGAGTNKTYKALCSAIKRTDLATDPRFASNQDRVRNRETLVPEIEAVTSTKTTTDWLRDFEKADIPAAPVNDMKSAFKELTQSSPEMVQTIEHPMAGSLHVLGVPFRFERCAGDIRLPPPMLGQHTDEVLEKTLGMKKEDIKKLREKKVIA